ARQLAALPLPPPSPAWDEAALLVERAQRGTDQQRAGLLLRAGKAMTDAYQAGPDVLAWWYGLLVPGPKPPR
ncbi:MAG: hypothetical protein L0H31_13460, partial [Nocardioidaceae bacterium]|nr:hypothetical protein [Nocardioidaceae bacterium]